MTFRSDKGQQFSFSLPRRRRRGRLTGIITGCKDGQRTIAQRSKQGLSLGGGVDPRDGVLQLCEFGTFKDLGEALKVGVVLLSVDSSDGQEASKHESEFAHGDLGRRELGGEQAVGMARSYNDG